MSARPFLQSSLVCAAVGCAMLVVATLPQRSSVAAGSNAKARGDELFATRGCAHCHGTAGIGGGDGPDLQLVRKRMNKVQITQQIHNGGKSMPAYGDQLTTPQINDLVAYLRTKRKLIVVPPKPAADLQNPAPQSDPN